MESNIECSYQAEVQMDLANKGLIRCWPYTSPKLPSKGDSIVTDDFVFGYVRSSQSREIEVLTNLIIDFCTQKGLYLVKIFYEIRVEYAKEGPILRAMLNNLQQEECIVKNVLIPKTQRYSNENQQLVKSLNCSLSTTLITQL